ncbi:MAG TPA: hypothetical protein VLA45_12520 [Paracoccaceae bacterium]|nr:hypothetical protein [Paracoccaceae bacterium]
MAGHHQLTPQSRAVVQALFPAKDFPHVEAMLLNECGAVQVHSPDLPASAIERIRLAALKCSGGDYDLLENAVLLAQTDWRDLLMAAGFGDNVDAHREWAAMLATT